MYEKKIIQSYFYYKDAREMRLYNFLYAIIQICLDRSLQKRVKKFMFDAQKSINNDEH